MIRRHRMHPQSSWQRRSLLHTHQPLGYAWQSVALVVIGQGLKVMPLDKSIEGDRRSRRAIQLALWTVGLHIEMIPKYLHTRGYFVLLYVRAKIAQFIDL